MCSCENKEAENYEYVKKSMPKIKKTYNTTNLSIAAQNISDSAMGLVDAVQNLTGTIVDSAQILVNSTFQNITGMTPTNAMDMEEEDDMDFDDELPLTFVESNLTASASGS